MGRNRGAHEARNSCYLLLVCDNTREILADTSSRFFQFREVLLAMEGKADAQFPRITSTSIFINPLH